MFTDKQALACGGLSVYTKFCTPSARLIPALSTGLVFQVLQIHYAQITPKRHDSVPVGPGAVTLFNDLKSLQTHARLATCWSKEPLWFNQIQNTNDLENESDEDEAEHAGEEHEDHEQDEVQGEFRPHLQLTPPEKDIPQHTQHKAKPSKLFRMPYGPVFTSLLPGGIHLIGRQIQPLLLQVPQLRLRGEP